MQYKYMRIQGREHSWVTKYPKGIFSMCWRLIQDGIMNKEDENKFREIDEWFKEHVYTNFVGTMVYEDEWQVAVQVENGEMI